MTDCIFCKLAAGSIPCRKVFEDDDLIAFHDLHPQAPVHLLLIPKRHIASLDEATPEDTAVLGKLLAHAGPIARAQGLTDGFRSIINTGRVGGQEVYHLHLHILGGSAPLGAMLRKREE